MAGVFALQFGPMSADVARVSHDHRDDDADRRVREMDASLRSANVALAAVVSLSSLLFVGRFGWVFFTCGSVAMVLWLLRLIVSDRVFGVAGWNRLLVLSAAAATAGGALVTGGMSSPLVFFSGVVAVVAHTMFRHERVFALLGVTVVVVVLVGDLLSGSSVDVLDVVSAFTVTGFLPVLVDRLLVIEETQRRSAVLDQLTGCLNRRALSTRSSELERQSQHAAGSLSVVVFDVDRFKRVNDEHGHAAGDQVLSQIATIVRRELRHYELLYRIGGEEFALVLPGADEAHAAAMAERLRSAIETRSGPDIPTTASFGVATQHSPFDVTAALRDADRRMYAAKRAGRNMVVSSSTVVLDH